MIAKIEGKLLKLEGDSALVQVGPVAYEIMLAGYCANILSDKIGSEISLCTMEYYEGTPGGGSFVPRMIGFLSDGEREFFRTFIRVKGIGIKRGLRTLSMPISNIAAAIENGDDKMLMALPGVGKRMSQQIVAELKGKLKDFAIGAEDVVPGEMEFKDFQIEALEILIAWGEKRKEAIELVELACKRHPEVTLAEQLVPLIYRLKQGAEV